MKRNKKNIYKNNLIKNREKVKSWIRGCDKTKTKNKHTENHGKKPQKLEIFCNTG